jgi:hypothetical protein
LTIIVGPLGIDTLAAEGLSVLVADQAYMFERYEAHEFIFAELSQSTWCSTQHYINKSNVYRSSTLIT